MDRPGGERGLGLGEFGSPAVFPHAGAHSGAGCSRHSSASPTLTERPLSTPCDCWLSLPLPKPPVVSAISPLRKDPRRKPELCADPELELPDAVRAISKVGGSQAGESAGAGKKGAAVSPREAGSRWLAGGRAGELTRALADWRAAAAPLPLTEQLSNRKQVPRTPWPARPPPAPHARSAGVLGPTAQPSVLSGDPAYLREAACPGERKARSSVRRGRSGGAPSLLARTHAAAAAASRSCSAPAAAPVATRPQGAWEKPAPPRRAAAPHRAAPSSPGPRPCRPARPQLRRRTPGRWRWRPPRSLPSAGDPTLKPPLPPGEP
ncbi:translation initiation factor IF-2-like [Sciurus carolinensis]|uniref:translation initiation factor IF-2-like n=1 Tax=Sciurus carolinensis TaxID=30640 RepID=UPI001FB56661|nr:translation initiation factor IF-2-like [Sciurus carolinensis]